MVTYVALQLPQRVSRTPYRADWVVTAFFGQSFAQPGNVHVNCSGINIDVAPPDMVEQEITAEHPAGLFHERQKQPVFRWAQFELHTVAADAVCSGSSSILS